MPGDDDAKPDGDARRADLEYGVDPDAPMKRAEKWAVFIAVLHVIAAFTMLLGAFSLVATLAGLACLVVGVFFVIASFVTDGVGFVAGLGGVALILAGSGILWLLGRYDLD